MSFASDALRAEAARFRRLKILISDAQAGKAIDDYAKELEERARAIDDQAAPSPSTEDAD